MDNLVFFFFSEFWILDLTFYEIWCAIYDIGTWSSFQMIILIVKLFCSMAKMGDEIFFCSDSFSIKSSLEVGSRVHVHLASYQLKEDYKTGQRAVLQTKISWIKAEHSFFSPPNFLFSGISFLKKMEFEGNIASKITMQAFRLEVSPVHVYSMKF